MYSNSREGICETQKCIDGASRTMGKQHGMIEEGTQWHQQQWIEGVVMENNKFKLMWDFEYK